MKRIGGMLLVLFCFSLVSCLAMGQLGHRSFDLTVNGQDKIIKEFEFGTMEISARTTELYYFNLNFKFFEVKDRFHIHKDRFQIRYNDRPVTQEAVKFGLYNKKGLVGDNYEVNDGETLQVETVIPDDNIEGSTITFVLNDVLSYQGQFYSLGEVRVLAVRP